MYKTVQRGTHFTSTTTEPIKGAKSYTYVRLATYKDSGKIISTAMGFTRDGFMEQYTFGKDFRRLVSSTKHGRITVKMVEAEHSRVLQQFAAVISEAEAFYRQFSKEIQNDTRNRHNADTTGSEHSRYISA